MAAKPLTPEQIRKILGMYVQHISNREIARSMHPPIYKGTVNRYISFVRNNGLSAETLLSLDDAELDRTFHKGDPAYTDKDKMDLFFKDLPNLQREREMGLGAYEMWSNYRERNKKHHYGIAQFCCHLSRAGLLPQSKTHAPTSDKEVRALVTTKSFETGHIDTDTGEATFAHFVILFMNGSGYMRLCQVNSLDICDIVEGINHLLKELGGVPPSLVTSDLLKTCTRRKDLKTSIGSVLKRMRSFYMCDDPIPPEESSLAGKKMSVALNHFTHMLATPKSYAGSDPVTLFEERYNRTRVRKGERTREEDFIRDERPRLTALPGAFYDVGEVGGHTPHVDGTIQVGRGEETGYYSVPVAYIGSRVQCIHGSSRILIMDDMGLIAAHPRVSHHRYSLQLEHVREWEASAYNDMRTLECKAFNISPRIADWVREFFRRAPEQGLHLQECVRKYENIEQMALADAALVAVFCERCCRENIYDYKAFIRGFYAYRDSHFKGRSLGNAYQTE